MAMKEKPIARDVTGGRMWENKFEKFYAKVFVPTSASICKIINYGYDAPYFLIFCDALLSDDDAIKVANNCGLAKIAAERDCSVVFINPTNDGGWKNAPDGIYEEIISNTKIHQYYEDGIAILNNRFFKTNEGFAIRGAIFRTCVIGVGDAADYIATHLIKKIEGDGLWGKADIAPTSFILQNLSVMPNLERKDINIVYIGDDDMQHRVCEKMKSEKEITSRGYVYCKKENNELPDLTSVYEIHLAKTMRWGWDGDFVNEKDYGEYLIEQPFVATLKTSSDNEGDDKDTESHDVGYICYYRKNLFKVKRPVPLLLCFHGGGDSAKYIAKVSEWNRICYDNKFLLVCVENHLNSTATEMMELLEILKKQFMIDESRIYATGFSMGGCKVWDLFQEYPDVFAGLAPMDATFDVAKNIYDKPSVGFHKSGKINRDVKVPIFYAGGEESPLPELPFQAEKCFDRVRYVLDVNGCDYTKLRETDEVTFENKNTWNNKIWGFNSKVSLKLKDESRNSVLTINLFSDKAKGDTITAFASVSGQGHECRYHTCKEAWKFLSKFWRVDGEIIEL